MKDTKNKEALSNEAREARNAYKRKWAKDNPEKVKDYTRRYWEKKAREAAAMAEG